MDYQQALQSSADLAQGYGLLRDGAPVTIADLQALGGPDTLDGPSGQSLPCVAVTIGQTPPHAGVLPQGTLAIFYNGTADTSWLGNFPAGTALVAGAVQPMAGGSPLPFPVSAPPDDSGSQQSRQSNYDAGFADGAKKNVNADSRRLQDQEIYNCGFVDGWYGYAHRTVPSYGGGGVGGGNGGQPPLPTAATTAEASDLQMYYSQGYSAGAAGKPNQVPGGESPNPKESQAFACGYWDAANGGTYRTIAVAAGTPDPPPQPVLPTATSAADQMDLQSWYNQGLHAGPAMGPPTPPSGTPSEQQAWICGHWDGSNGVAARYVQLGPGGATGTPDPPPQPSLPGAQNSSEQSDLQSWYNQGYTAGRAGQPLSPVPPSPTGAVGSPTEQQAWTGGHWDGSNAAAPRAIQRGGGRGNGKGGIDWSPILAGLAGAGAGYLLGESQAQAAPPPAAQPTPAPTPVVQPTPAPPQVITVQVPAPPAQPSAGLSTGWKWGLGGGAVAIGLVATVVILRNRKHKGRVE